MISNEGGCARSFHSGFIPHRRGDRPVAPTPRVGCKFLSFGSHLQHTVRVSNRDVGCSLPSFGSHLQRRGGRRHPRLRVGGCSLPSFGSHLQRLLGCTLPLTRCSLPSFGSHLQPDAVVMAHMGWCSLPSFGSHLQRYHARPHCCSRCSLPSFGSHLQREPHNPLICKDFVPSFATASSWLPSAPSEISCRAGRSSRNHTKLYENRQLDRSHG